MKFTWKSFSLVVFVLIFLGCEKDLPTRNEDYAKIPPSEISPPNNAITKEFFKGSWSPKEEQFFSLAPPLILQQAAESESRNTELNNDKIYHPLIIEGYNKIAEQNEEADFVEIIVDEMGSPYWEKAIVYDNGNPSEQIALVPFLDDESDKFSGLLSIEKEQGELVINGMSRENLLRSDEGNAQQRLSYTEWMYSYQSWLLNTTRDTELDEAYCHYLERVVTGGEGQTSGGTGGGGGINCEWRIVELCSDDETQTTWIGGRNNIPPHLDHDGDGILNQDDQDWLEFSRRFGITQEEWQGLIFDWWADHQEAAYGNYQDYYESYDDYWDDIFHDFWQDYEEWIREYDDDHNIFDDPYDGWPPYAGGGSDWGPDDDRDPGDYPGDGCTHSDGGREIRCSFVYMLHCSGEDGDEWWDFENTIVCHSCTNEQDNDYEAYYFQQKFDAFISEYNLQSHSSYLSSLLNPGDCPSQVDNATTFSCFASVLMDIFLEENEAVILNDEERIWLQEHPGVLGELLVVSEGNGQGQLSQAYVDQFIGVCTNLQLDDENARWLLSEPAVLAELSQHLLSGRFHPDELHYSIWAIRNFGNDLDYYIDKLNEFRGEEPPFVDDIENGISILNSFVPVDAPENYPSFVQTPYRPGHEYDPGAGIIPEDLLSRTDGDPDLLSDSRPNNRALDSKSDAELFDIFEGLITSWWLNRDLTEVAEIYKDRFQNSTGGDYFNAELSEYVRTNDHMKVTAKDFGKWLNDRLIETGGDINAIDPDAITDPARQFGIQYRAIFDSGENRSGLKILMNDTEKLDVYTMDDFTFNPANNEWSGTFYFVVYDNFGLDNQDLIDFQGYYDILNGTGSPLNFNRGFAAWWILQHRRGYVPFRTEVRTAFQLKGDLDN